MQDALLVSNALLWVLVLALVGVIVALVRQIGVLYERVAPAGALMSAQGPKVGESAPELRLRDLAGEDHDLGGQKDLATLLFFLSPTCPVCKTLLPVLKSVASSERSWLQVMLASDGPKAEHEAFVSDRGLQQFPYLVSTDLGLAYRVAKLPYAVLIDATGVIRAQGLVNTREHLESMFEAQERGVASIQDFIERNVQEKGVA